MAISVYLLFWVMDFYHDRRAFLNRPAHVNTFIETYQGLAETASAQTGVPAPLILAVGALESAWGSSELARQSNNFFGIKARGGGGPKYCLPTREFTNGRPYTIRACFRAYDDPEGSFRDFARMLSSEPRYQPLLAHPPEDYSLWARDLQELGYATDPRYAEKIIQVVQQYRLQ